MNSSAVKPSQLRAVEQAQQSLEFAAIVGGGVELEGKSASIKSSSECIQSSNAISFSSCFVLCSERSICISLAGSRRQLSSRSNERKRDSDEPDAPWLLERELAGGPGDKEGPLAAASRCRRNSPRGPTVLRPRHQAHDLCKDCIAAVLRLGRCKRGTLVRAA